MNGANHERRESSLLGCLSSWVFDLFVISVCAQTAQFVGMAAHDLI